MRYLGLDVGQQKIGVAIGETLATELTTITCPTPTKFYKDKGYEHGLAEIKKIIKLEEIDGLVIGLPVNETGEQTEESKKIKIFSKKLEKNLDIIIHFVDETLTSFMAGELLSSQDIDKEEIEERVHQASAQLILQQYLENNG